MIRLGHHQLYGAICKFNCSSMIRFSPCWFPKHSRRGEDGWEGERRLEEWKLAVSCILSFNFNEWLAVFFCFLIVTMIRLRCIHVIAPRLTCWAMLWTLALGICGSGSVHWKWSCGPYYGQTSAVSGGPAVTVSTDRCREDGPTTAVPGSAVRTAGCCSNKCPHLDHLTNPFFRYSGPFFPFK